MLSNEIIEINMTINNETGKPEITEKILNKGEIITLKEYIDNPECIDTLKLPILKKNLKHYKNRLIVPSSYSPSEKKVARQVIRGFHDFALVGNKKVILSRLKTHFEQERLAIQIQKIVRKTFVKISMQLVGPAMKNRKLCTNDTDFYTFEPLEEIPYDNFFSYKDEHNFIYGFELSSLVEYIKNKRRGNKHLTNPYTRGSFADILPNIYRLIRINNIIFKKNLFVKKTETKTKTKTYPHPRMISNSYQSRSLLLGVEYQYNHSSMLEFVRSTRAKSIVERTRALFMEIDQLGNYSNHEWFDNLERRCYLRYFKILKDIWCYRAQIPINIKIKICPLWDPFIMLSTDDLADLTMEQLKARCLCVMEDMIYTGVDTEFKTLGAFHVLSVLTVVSRDARLNMPWLYESLM
jgi:hypothetical protein